MRDLCFIDTETTGLDSSQHEIIEIALIRTSPDLVPKEKFSALILPQHIETATPIALEINHYDEERWKKEAIPLAEALPKVLSLTESCIMAGHNVPFDMNFLEAAVKDNGFKPNWNYHRFDTCSLAIPFMAEKRVRSLSLGRLLDYFGIKKDKDLHSAKNDIEYTLQLAQKMMECLRIMAGPPPLPATLVAIEGIDGAGKSCLVKALIEKLGLYGFSAGSTQEPTRESEQGKQIRAHVGRMDPLTEMTLFMEDRKIHQPVIKALRESYDIAILDRYYPSSMAYQGPRLAKQEGDSLVHVMSWIQKANESFSPKPDLVIVLDVEPSVGIQRLLKRGRGQDSFEEEESLSEVREAFRVLKEENLLNCPVKIIDTCALSQEEIVERAFQHIKKVYFG